MWVGPPGHCYLKTNSSSGYERPGGGRYSCKPNKTAASGSDEATAIVGNQNPGVTGVQSKPLHHGEEVHGPYGGGGGWPAIDGRALGHSSGPELMYGVPMDLRQVGVAATGYMRTETGYTSMSSFESMSATLPQEQWGLETESMHERNYPCHTHIRSYFGENMSLSGVGAKPFQKRESQIFPCLWTSLSAHAWLTLQGVRIYGGNDGARALSVHVGARLPAEG